MIDLGYSVAQNKKNIQNLDDRATSMQEEIVALKSKINEVNELRQLIKVLWCWKNNPLAKILSGTTSNY